jgi:microcystin-dependent protein
MKHIVLVTAIVSLLAVSIRAQVPQIINYQGRISAGGSPYTGVGQFKFALVSTDGSTTYWSNDGTSTAGSEPTASVSLPTAAGLYVAPLGDTAIVGMLALPPAAFSNNGVKLRVWFNDGTNGSQLLAPDQQVLSVAYAMMAAGVPNAAITTAMIAPGAVTSDKLSSDFSIPVGTVVAFAGTTAPAGWRLCDGAPLDGTLPENSALFAALGLTYGGAGSNFLLPDMRGRAAVGSGQGPTLTNRLLAAKFGAETHTLTVAQMPAHNHSGTTSTNGSHSHSTSGASASDDGGGTDSHFALGDSDAVRGWPGVTVNSAGNHNHTIPSEGGNAAHNIVQPSLALNYIIKL